MIKTTFSGHSIVEPTARLEEVLLEDFVEVEEPTTAVELVEELVKGFEVEPMAEVSAIDQAKLIELQVSQPSLHHRPNRCLHHLKL